MGLPRAYRLTQKRQFDRVLKNRSVYLRNGPFRVYAVSTTGDIARLGLIVGKRQARRAVDRNRIKRIIRETFRARHDALPPFDVVVQLAEPMQRSAMLAATANGLWSKFLEIHEKQHAHRAEP